jgi:hypothetical protein
MFCLCYGENITPQCHDVFKIALIKVGLYSPYLSEKLIQEWKFVWKFILVNMPTFDAKFFLPTPLSLLQDPWIVYRCFQAVIIFFLLKVAKLSIYTYKGPSDMFMSSQEAFCKIHTPFTPVCHKKMLRKDISSLFYISLTVHLSIILVNNQLDTLFSMYLIISPLYMFRATQCSSSGESNCINTSSGIYHSL